jgi:transposase
MARPYSMDLRERALARVQAGESVRVVARALSISPSSVVKWSQRFRTTGSAAAGKMGGHRPRLLVGAHAAFLRERRRGVAPTSLDRLVASIAPVCSAALRKLSVRVDIEAQPPKLGPFVDAINAALSDPRAQLLEQSD